jgi:hypothetical protein
MHVGLGFIKIGILPSDNTQQVDLAFSLYSDIGFRGNSLSHGFKRAFT